MGRTQRLRRRRKTSSDRRCSLGHEKEYRELIAWMKHNGWNSTISATPSDFSSTGRGLCALQNISAGDIIANIPGKLLMTTETASNSLFGWLFKRKTFMCQQVLAAHLMFERHLGNDSFWADYISYLPAHIGTPIFSKSELDTLPEELNCKISDFNSNVSEMFSDLSSSFLPEDKCSHCSKTVLELFSYEHFSWAWFIINSRAVFISPEHNNDHSLSLFDKNCLALAPYLDIFNHSNEAKVQAVFNEVDKSYQVKTLTPFKKFSQVFIHYGDHSNVKLFLEYGFIMTNNIHDTLSVTFEEVFSTLEVHQQRVITKSTYQFLKSHDFLSNMYLNADGISWSTRALIFVLLFSGTLDPKTIQLKVYSNDFNENEMHDIFKIGKVLVENKRTQIKDYLQKMLSGESFNLMCVSGGLSMAVDLYKEYLNVLCHCDLALK